MPGEVNQWDSRQPPGDKAGGEGRTVDRKKDRKKDGKKDRKQDRKEDRKSKTGRTTGKKKEKQKKSRKAGEKKGGGEKEKVKVAMAVRHSKATLGRLDRRIVQNDCPLKFNPEFSRVGHQTGEGAPPWFGFS